MLGFGGGKEGEVGDRLSTGPGNENMTYYLSSKLNYRVALLNYVKMYDILLSALLGPIITP